MAAVHMLHQWPDGSITQVSVQFEDSYPDALARAVDEAARAWGHAVEEADDDDRA